MPKTPFSIKVHMDPVCEFFLMTALKCKYDESRLTAKRLKEVTGTFTNFGIIMTRMALTAHSAAKEFRELRYMIHKLNNAQAMKDAGVTGRR